MKTIGIIGGSGYVAGELIRLLVNHDQISISYIQSLTNAGRPVSSVHRDLEGDLDIAFSSDASTDVDLVFLCRGHGHSKGILDNYEFNGSTKIIDMSNGFRLKPDSLFGDKEFVYGLPELHHEKIKTSDFIANPGCYATALQLAVLPLAEAGLLKDDLHLNGVTGSTGAGALPSETTHFSWRDNNFSSYKPFSHQHLDEVQQGIKILQPGFSNKLFFIPHRGNFSRGIFSTVYTSFSGTISEAETIYESFYEEAPFVKIVSKPLHLKQVVNTNKCLLHLHKYDGKLLITSILDNLLKGASGQAVQNMNLTFGFAETEGLQLKANFF